MLCYRHDVDGSNGQLVVIYDLRLLDDACRDAAVITSRGTYR